MEKLKREFYSRDSITVAQELLGKILVHENNGKIISGKIVETEAYMGVEDKAAHSYGGRRTKRVEVMYGQAGFAYVFMIYGIHYCFNIVTEKIDTPQAVLIRAVEPVEGLEYMAINRFNKELKQLTKTETKNLTNGPGKLSKALLINMPLNGEDLCDNRLYVKNSNKDKFNIISSKRIGIDYAQEAKDYLWRFYIEGNSYVSIK